MLYEFRCRDCGRTHERAFPMREAPVIGATLPCPGCRGVMERIPSNSAQVSAAVKRQVHGFPYESISETGLEGCERGPRGGSIIRSAHHEREVAKMNGLGVL